MEFKDLTVGSQVYILESAGTFRKINTYNIGSVVSVGLPYDDNNVANPYLSSMLKKKLVDITISCEGILKKITVGADKSTITDSTIGLTISTDKSELITQIQTLYKEYLDKIAAIELYKEEAEKCKRILDQLKEPPKEEVIQTEPKVKDTIRVS